MSKNLLQDIRPLSSTSRQAPAPAEETIYKGPRLPDEDSLEDEISENHPRNRAMWIIAVVAVIILFFSISFLFLKPNSFSTSTSTHKP